jgi:hypothetical protein
VIKRELAVVPRAILAREREAVAASAAEPRVQRGIAVIVDLREHALEERGGDRARGSRGRSEARAARTRLAR